ATDARRAGDAAEQRCQEDARAEGDADARLAGCDVQRSAPVGREDVDDAGRREAVHRDRGTEEAGGSERAAAGRVAAVGVARALDGGRIDAVLGRLRAGRAILPARAEAG